MPLLIDSPAWQALLGHQRQMADVHMRDLLAGNPQRFERFSVQLGDILFDYSKNRTTDTAMALLLDLAYQANLSELKGEQSISAHDSSTNGLINHAKSLGSSA